MSSKRKQVYLAVAGSVGIHLAVLFAWALSVQWFPGVQAATSQPPEPVQVEMVEQKPDVTPPPAPDLLTPTPTPPLVYKDTDIDTSDLAEAAHAPKDAIVQSDRNAEAASTLPATGDKPLPTQKGKRIPSFAFDTHPYTPGDSGSTAGQNVPANMPPPVLDTAPPLPRPASTPRDASTPPPAAPAATPAASVADPRDLAMITPQSIPSTPAEAEPNPYDPAFRPPSSMTEPPRPTPVPRRGGYRPFQERTQSDGGIGKPGADSVASEATPAGRYITAVKAAVNARYHQFVDARADMITFGEVKVAFTIDRDGKVLTTHVVYNHANDALATVAIRALAEAKISPMPTEVASIFDGGIMPMSIVFTLE